MLVAVLGCSEGGLWIYDPALDSGGPTHASTAESGESEAEAFGESDDPFEAGGSSLDDGPFDEGSLDEGALDEGESGDGEPGEANAVFVAPDGDWHYATGASVDAGWTMPEFDDLGWPSGAAPLGHGMAVSTEVPSTNGQPTAWFRAAFELVDPSVIAGLDLRLRRDDGAIAYLNGVEILRSNMPSNGVEPTTRAVTEARGPDENRYMRAFPDITLLRVGANVLAVEIHDRELNPEDRVIDALLQSVDPDVPPTELEIRVRTITDNGSKYGPRNVGAIWIERQDGSFLRTLEVWGDTRREHLVAWRTASDENDMDAVTSSTLKTHATHVATWDLTDLDGQPVAPGGYRIRVEFTEENSNGNAADGPQITVDFELDQVPDRVSVPTSGDASAFTDLLLWAP
jgi:hypothetical protein